MANIQPMLEAHPGRAPLDVDMIANFIEELVSCAQHCSVCADSCLADENVVQMRECIRRNLDCADSCLATAAQGSRLGRNEQSAYLLQVQACMEACRVCAEECESHARNSEHCRICGESCRRCEQACQKVLEALG